MRKLLVAAVVVMAFATGRADANPHGDGLTARGVNIDRHSGAVVPTATRLHPVIGSTQIKSHFNLPFTHKARYTTAMYNPLLGSFTSRTFKR